jgi:murein DD-endopeptidase MepM/ murein hydrolase activator NlpD
MQKLGFLLLLVFSSLLLSAQLEQSVIKDLQKGKIKEDTSFVYILPYTKNKSFLMVQGPYTKHSHRYLVALDFKMKKGSTICAARSGVVLSVEESSSKGGLNDKYLNDWNYIVLQHADSSTALYGHLQQNGALVNVGDTIQQGQAIALSGNTGYSAFPHLHFQVWDKYGEQISVRFLTKRGIIYLRPLRWYRAIQKQ